MSKQDLVITLRSFRQDDFNAWLWIHEHQLPSVNSFDEGYFPTQGFNERYFNSLITEYEELRENHDAFIFGAFDQGQRLCAIVQLITLTDDLKTAELKLRVFNLYYNQGVGKQSLQLLCEKAKEIGYTKLLAHCSLHHEVAQKLFTSLGFNDEGHKLVQECDQVCWPTKHVFSINL
jgi:[ribosomal protein S5]-alanine N-acetyltransferase